MTGTPRTVLAPGEGGCRKERLLQDGKGMRPDCAIAQSHVPGQDSKRAWWGGWGQVELCRGKHPFSWPSRQGKEGGLPRKRWKDRGAGGGGRRGQV